MKTTDPEALKALARLAAGNAVIYLPGQPIPYPLGWAGEHKGKAAFLMGTEMPHEIPADLRAVVTDVGVAYYDGKALQYYVTTVAEAAEVLPGAMTDAIAKLRDDLETVGGVAAVLANY